jgi:hypothetical protein
MERLSTEIFRSLARRPPARAYPGPEARTGRQGRYACITPPRPGTETGPGLAQATCPSWLRHAGQGAAPTGAPSRHGAGRAGKCTVPARGRQDGLDENRLGEACLAGFDRKQAGASPTGGVWASIYVGLSCPVTFSFPLLV